MSARNQARNAHSLMLLDQKHRYPFTKTRLNRRTLIVLIADWLRWLYQPGDGGIGLKCWLRIVVGIVIPLSGWDGETVERIKGSSC